MISAVSLGLLVLLKAQTYHIIFIARVLTVAAF